MRCSFLKFCDLIIYYWRLGADFSFWCSGVQIPPCPPAAGFFLGGPEFKSTTLCKYPTGCLPAVGFLYAFVFILPSMGCICPRYSQILERKCSEKWILMGRCRLPLSNSTVSKSFSFCLQDPEVDNFFRHCQKFDGTPSTDIEMVKLLKVRTI